MEDKGIYSIEIMEFVKKDEAAFCDCIVDIEGTLSHFDIQFKMVTHISLACTKFIRFALEYPHKFTSKLKGQSVVEHDKCEFEIDVEAEDADVTWCLNGKPIQADGERYLLFSFAGLLCLLNLSLKQRIDFNFLF